MAAGEVCPLSTDNAACGKFLASQNKWEGQTLKISAKGHKNDEGT